MRQIAVTCANGARYQTQIEDNEQIAITAAGELKIIGPDYDGMIKTLKSPAVALHELVPVAGDL